MLDKRHFMLDLETLATTPDAVVLSIGAVEFNPFTGQILSDFYHILRLEDQSHRKVNPDTVIWWVENLNEKNKDVFTQQQKTPVRNALLLLSNYLGDEKKAIWACDPDFDCAILANLYAEYHLPCPWKYYEPKSVRTVRELAKLHNISLEKTAVAHNALDDCKEQVKDIAKFNSGIVSSGINL